MHIRAFAFVLVALCVLSSLTSASDSLADLPKKAVERSQITAPGSSPFSLKAKVVEITNLANTNYQAEIEEQWVAPDKWRRTVKTSSFSQTLIVNGDKMSEQVTGDYYPNWLRTIVAAIFEPDKRLEGVDLSRSSDNPVIGGNQTCRRFTYIAGVAPVSNRVFSTFCFENGLLESISTPGYRASYKDYKNFRGKRVARTIGEYIESGTELQATITEVRELASPDETQFAVQETGTPLRTIQVSEEAVRNLVVNAPEMVWPTVRSGAVKGTLSLYVCVDRAGHVREIYELNSAGETDFARNEVMKWQFRPAVSEGTPVQVESILTFAFNTVLADPIPVLEEEEGRKLILHRVEPIWPEGFAPAGTPVIVTVGVNENGDFKSLVFITSDGAHRALAMRQLARIDEPLKRALKGWKFKPYMPNGKVTEYQMKVTFYVN